ncbi:hypothetical protein pdam_00006340 [Pocillopora damicornis]|uniref:Peptidase M13 N-terminal domain-containing protein n=1 Tax=Pocillopora damicornis TaxID=46731 RepID=A0A3M6TQN6_POCDA|nr:hypothetical protein pdam_00006340 [Pocillopora damicornis]
MADPKYRLTMEEKMHLDGNSNSPDGHIIHSRKRVQRNGCSTSVLVFVVVLLSLACISLVIFLAIEKLQRNDEIRSSFCRTVLGTSNSSGNVTPPCTSVQCILASANILRTVDQNVDPCEDFFLHACGGWIKSNPIPPNEPLWNQVLALKKRNDQLLKRLLDDKTVRKRYIVNDAVQKAFLYYDSCTDQDAIEHAKGSPLLELIARYGSWNITNKTWTSDSWNFAETLVRIHKELKLSPLFTLQVKPDLVESSRYVIMIDQTTHTITRDAYLANTSYHYQVRLTDDGLECFEDLLGHITSTWNGKVVLTGDINLIIVSDHDSPFACINVGVDRYLNIVYSSDNPEEQFEHLNSMFKECIERHAPLRRERRDVRNKLKAAIRRARETFTRQALSSNKPKVWRIIHRILKPNQQPLRQDPDRLDSFFACTTGRTLPVSCDLPSCLKEEIESLPDDSPTNFKLREVPHSERFTDDVYKLFEHIKTTPCNEQYYCQQEPLDCLHLMLLEADLNLLVRKAYQQLMSELINLIGGETKWAEHQLKEVFEFEQDLSKLSATANERADRSKVYKLMTLKELQNKTEKPIDWLFYIKAMFQDTSYEIEQDEELAIFALDYLTNMSSLITNTPERVLANYMMWQVVVQLAPHLSEEYRRAFYNYHRVVMGSSGETDIWKKCITEMSRLDNDIGDPLGVIFLDEKFEKKDKESVMAMIDDLRETFIANLDKLDWMDNKTRAYAREKVHL